MKIKSGQTVEKAGTYKCTKCGNELTFAAGDVVPHCPRCGNNEFELQ